jgi:hypothetical protein
MVVGGLERLSRDDLLSDSEIVRVVQTAASLGVNKIRLTGGLQVPGIRQRMAKEVQAQVRVGVRLEGGGKKLPARPDGAGHQPGNRHPLGAWSLPP